MSTNELKRTAARAIRLAHRGTTAEIESFENAAGRSLSTVIDECWAEAEGRNEDALVRNLERAYNEVTGR
jgi:hypothetical protein